MFAYALVSIGLVCVSLTLGLYLGYGYGRSRGFSEGYRACWKQIEFDARMDAATGYDAAAARAEAYGLPHRPQPAEVYDHETEGL